jgi:hypothetical protein
MAGSLKVGKQCIRMKRVSLFRWETVYLAVLSIASLLAVFYLINEGFAIDTTSGDAASTKKAQSSLIFNGLLLSLAAGTLGGCCFGGKCLYHFIAKRLWHEDRRIWRILAPPLSGVLSLILVMLVASGLFQIFDPKFIESPLRVAALAALAGYFSDKALAKMSEIADTLFGPKAAPEDPKDTDERSDQR